MSSKSSVLLRSPGVGGDIGGNGCEGGEGW